MDKYSKGKYEAVSLKMKKPYDQLMKVYRHRKIELATSDRKIKSLLKLAASARKTKSATRRLSKRKVTSKQGNKVIPTDIKKKKEK